MKKFFLILAMMFTMSVYSFADESTASKMAESKKYELKFNHRRLACVLDMSGEQMEISDYLCSKLENDMIYASTMDTDERRADMVNKTIKEHIKNMHYVLNHEQYRKYIMLLNLTLEHKGWNLANKGWY